MPARTTLGLDLSSTVVGWAYFRGRELDRVGEWKISAAQPGDGPGARWLRLLDRLQGFGKANPVDAVAYEVVTFGKRGAWRAVQRWGGAEAILELWMESQGFRESAIARIHVADLKTLALGKGGGPGTGKGAMLRAARRRWGEIDFPGDHAADAAFAALAAIEGLHRRREEAREAKRKTKGRKRRGRNPQLGLEWKGR